MTCETVITVVKEHTLTAKTFGGTSVRLVLRIYDNGDTMIDEEMKKTPDQKHWEKVKYDYGSIRLEKPLALNLAKHITEHFGENQSTA